MTLLVKLRSSLAFLNADLKRLGYDPDRMGTIDLDPGVNEMIGRRNAIQEVVEALTKEEENPWEARALAAEADLEGIREGLKGQNLNPIEARAVWVINERGFLRMEREAFDEFRNRVGEGKGVLTPEAMDDICKKDPGHGTIATDEAFGPTMEQIHTAAKIQHRFDTARLLKTLNSKGLFEKACLRWMAVEGIDMVPTSDFRHNMGHLFQDVLRPELIAAMTDQAYDPGTLDMEPRFKALEELVTRHSGALDCWDNGYGAGTLDALRVLQGRLPLREGLPFIEPEENEACPAPPEFLDAWAKGETHGDDEPLNFAIMAKTTAWLARKG